MSDFIRNLIGNDILATAIMSIVPLIELKGGIVFARTAGLDFFSAFGLAFLGSTIVFIPIYFLLRPLLNLLKRIKFIDKFAFKVENYFNQKAEGAYKKQNEQQNQTKKKRSDTFLKQLGVFIFVAIPLPMTGVWTGTAIAVFLNLKFKDTILPIVLGNLVAGLIISGLSALFIEIWTIDALNYVLYGLFALALILLVVVIIKIMRSKPKEDSENN